MDGERRAAALEARAAAQKAQAAGQNSRNTRTGLAALLAPGAGRRMRPSGGGSGGGWPGGNSGGGAAGREGEVIRRGTLWFLAENGRPACIQVGLGISDGSFTEIRALGPGELEGREFILRERI
jgi:hypothetical protein